MGANPTPGPLGLACSEYSSPMDEEAMSLTAILGAIAALGTIFGGIIYLVKRFSSTTANQVQTTTAGQQSEDEQAKKSGRPDWNAP